VLALGAPANSDAAEGADGEEPGTLTFKFGVIPTADKEERKLFWFLSFRLVAARISC
jgi:hypothetical protein